MTKRITCFVLAALLLLGCGMSALAAGKDYAIHVDDVLVEKAYAVRENGTTYVAAYFVIQAMYPEAEISWAGGATKITAPGLTVTAKTGDPYIVANGRYLYVSGGVRVHPETEDTMVPVRVLARAMGATVSYDDSGVYLTAGEGPILSGDRFYNAEDLDLIARVIRHEAGNQPLKGKIAVGNVILHRVASRQFPNSVSGVLYQKNQFTGATNCKANEASIIAAKLCLEGVDVVPGACWFNGVGKAFWASRNKSLIATIGNHSFYG